MKELFDLPKEEFLFKIVRFLERREEDMPDLPEERAERGLTFFVD